MSLDSSSLACSRVPEEYVPQHPTNGNPPTLFLALSGTFSLFPFLFSLFLLSLF